MTNAYNVFSLPFLVNPIPIPSPIYLLQLGSVGLCDSYCHDIFPSLVTSTEGTHTDSMAECCQWADIAEDTHTITTCTAKCTLSWTFYSRLFEHFSYSQLSVYISL